METRYPSLRLITLCPFYTSYKGWKQITPIPQAPLYLLFILPIRDGNFQFVAGVDWDSILFILPIRDGNHKGTSVKTHEENTFYTSYKGWKLNFFCSCKGFFYLLFILPIRDGNKFISSHRSKKSALFILPIRDGNSILRVELIKQICPFYTSYKGWKPSLPSLVSPIVAPFLYFL